METDHLKDSFKLDKQFGKGINDIIDCSLQGKDFVSDLNAEIDLDETGYILSAEKKGSEEAYAEEMQGNLDDSCESTENVRKGYKFDSGAEIESLGELQSDGEIQDAREVGTGLETENGDMGNTLDDNKRMDSILDGGLDDQENFSNDSGETCKELKNHETDMASDIVTRQDSDVIERDLNQTKSTEHKTTNDYKESMIESLDENSLKNDQETVTVGEDSGEQQDMCDSGIGDANSTARGKNTATIENNEPSEDTHDEVDREKIKCFIEEVINDLQGIVIETEECDSTVQEICLQSVTPYLDNMRDGSCEADLINSENEDLTIKEEDGCCDLGTTESSEKITKNKENVNLENDNDADEDKVGSNTGSEKLEMELRHTEEQAKEPNFKKPKKERDHQRNKAKDVDITVASNIKMSNACGEQSQKNGREAAMLMQELEETRVALHASQCSLKDERAKHNHEVMRLKLVLYRTQTDLKHQRTKSEKQLTEVMTQLVILESQLRREQKKLQVELRRKNDKLDSQHNEILKLKEQNAQLYHAIQEICANGGMNGYMRENKRKHGNYSDGFDSGGKGGRGKLGTMKDKFMAKNRSSMELSNINLEKYLIKNERLCSSQEDLRRAFDDERRRSIPSGDTNFNGIQRLSVSPNEFARPVSDGIEYKNGKHRKNVRYHHQNFVGDIGSPEYEMNKSVSESSHLSESTNSSSGVYSLSEHDLTSSDISQTNGHHFITEHNDDDEDDRIFSFSSTHIDTVIREEEALGPVPTHSNTPLTSMGSMPMLANLKEEHSLRNGKDRPHSLSSVDLFLIQQQTKNNSKSNKSSPLAIPQLEMSTPPASPSYHTKTELTPFQTFKTMFRRSKNKGNKKRSVSLSQTTNTEYLEAMKKHFQKYDMQ